MSEIYWLTRLDGLSTLLYVLMSLGIIMTFISGICYFAANREEEVKASSSYFRWGVVTTVFIAFSAVMIPNSKEAFMIYGIGSTVDYLNSNEVAKNLPDQCIKYLDAWVEKIIEDPQYKQETGFNK
jgi:hypothetical protein